MDACFVPTLRSPDPVTILSEPYFLAEIEATDHGGIYYIPSANTVKSNGCDTKMYGGFRYYGFSATNTTAAGSLTADVDLAESGEYRVFVRVLKSPERYSPKITLSIDSKEIDTVDISSNIPHSCWIDFGKHDLSSGIRTFIASWNSKDTWIESFILRKVNTLSTKHTRTATSLDATKAKYTKNTISELNIATLDLLFKEDFYNQDNPYSRMVFDFMDTVTFWVGETRSKARPEFGGYLTSYSLNPSSDTISLTFGDRLIDLYRTPVYGNFSIGIEPSSEDKPVFPQYNFNNVFQYIQYQCAVNEFPLLCDVRVPCAFRKDMGNIRDYNSISVAGYVKKHDLQIGNPPPGLMLSYENVSLAMCSENNSLDCSAILYEYEGEPANAADNEILAFDYMAKGQATVYPFRFNIVVSMYKEDEEPSDAEDYTITFNSSVVEGQIIGHVPPQLTGTMSSFKFDLKKAFDNSSAASSAYYITQIKMVDSVDATVKNLQNRILFVDNIAILGKVASVAMNLNMEAKYPIEAIRQVAADGNYDGYVQYGNERRFDTFIFTEANASPSVVAAEQGVNILDLKRVDYKPDVSSGTGEGFGNSALRHYHFKSDKITKTGSSYYVNLDSFLRYGPFENYKDLTDVDNKADSDKNAEDYVKNNSYYYPGFSMDITGTVLINPSEYLVTEFPQRLLSGNHIIKSMENSLDLLDEEFITTIDLNLPSDRFTKAIMEIKRQLLGYASSDSRSMYSFSSLRSMGLVSPGAFVQRRTY